MTIWMPNPDTLSRPAYLSLAEQFARAIEGGHLPPGARLLPQRKLADRLGLSLQTVSRAYDELIRRGLIQGEVGRGSFVLGPGGEARQPYLPERPGEVIDLSILKPVVETLHMDRLREGFAWLADNLAAASALSFRPNMVMPHHRAVAVDWLNGLGVPAEPSGIVLTNGATPAITAAVMSAAPPGAGIAAAALTHHTLKPLCTYLGLHLEGLAIDAHGLIPAALDEAARRGQIRAVYLQPNVINPLAVMMPADRRAELVEVIRRHDLAIIENDILNMMIADRAPAFATLAPERTLYICGFTKITVPGLRLAYLHAPPRFATAAANRHLVSNWMATPPMADLLSHWVTDGTVAELAAWQARAMADRHALACEVLGAQMPVCHPNSLHLWLPLPEGWTEEAFVEQARFMGLGVAAGHAFRASDKAPPQAIRVSLGSTRAEDLRRGLSLISGLLKDTPEPPLPTI
ncbi:PLP-dependent aminotransferase family protein [Cereibacter azotoformans]|uniref:Transcriptional regulator, GntR family n=1 Tax=Cereibacter sphaeroides (strain ATCC 17025 / ATH 2.4.3) TaxID=349102 RepID=A4WXD9_CERS5|nr:PLP-dependent aminotransferase family protein [Cereibacter azotoformans]ULB11508.1 PLP-dependent aminotransferase family protein [Cereibacter azotoformans]